MPIPTRRLLFYAYLIVKKTQRQARWARRWVMVAWFLFGLVEIGRVDLGEERRLGRQFVQREHGI